MADPDPPQYTVYRSRPRLPWRRGDDDGPQAPQETPPREPRRRRRLRPGRILAYLAMAVTAWLLVSAIVFLISAQIQS